VGKHQLILGDCLEAMAELPACSVDAVVCDPPYGLGFMGKTWDALPPGEPWAREVCRVLKPGGHVVAFGGTRTSHRLACAIEDAGFDIRDTISWLYWSGFPKSFDVSKAIDLAAGEAKTWDGWGTALKPATEPAILARKPLEGTVAANVLKWRTGGLNIDGCRMAYGDPAWPGPQGGPCGWGGAAGFTGSHSGEYGLEKDGEPRTHDRGRWPANIYHCAKPSRSEREAGCAHLPSSSGADAVGREEGTDGLKSPRAGAGHTAGAIHNIHPTVKPIQIMAWLCRLVTPPGGVVLDPFMGSGTTGIAALRQGFDFIGIEREARYLEIARARIEEDAPLFNRVQAV